MSYVKTETAVLKVHWPKVYTNSANISRGRVDCELFVLKNSAEFFHHLNFPLHDLLIPDS